MRMPKVWRSTSTRNGRHAACTSRNRQTAERRRERPSNEPLLDSPPMTTGAPRTSLPNSSRLARCASRQAESRRHRRAVGATVGDRRYVPFRPVPRTRRSFLDRHAAADGERLAAHGFGVRVRADRRARALPAHAGPRGLLPDGLGRQRSRDRAARAELLRRALRSAPAVRSRRFEPPEKPPKDAIAISRPNFLELCARLVAQDEQAFEALWRGLGLSVDWTLTYTTIGTSARRTSQRAFLRNLARGEAYQADAPTLVGRRLSAPRSRRPSSKTASWQARTTRCASIAPTVPAIC